ncbi:MAG: wax ester/triacylglycerol synthase domain-containing protein [Nocardioidaceae bacterium]
MADGRHAVLAKSHQALVDGTTVDLAQLIVDDAPDLAPTPDVAWTPERVPSGAELLAETLGTSVRHPGVLVDQLQGHAAAAKHVADRALDALTGLAGRLRAPAR